MENFIQPSISVYPNPSEGIFHVQLPNDDLFLFVADIYGQNLYSRYTQEASTIIDLSKYPKEIYILSVEGNSQKYRAKLVKK
ncbi:MAG: T9SS type A sorting domain-containing protein [Dysgonamonadaceae bacterium]|nr:T9SS type A sorting domain-containing protein [Dysgonamonadaceae bacterium]